MDNIPVNKELSQITVDSKRFSKKERRLGASGGLEGGWAFSSLVSSEGLLPFLGHSNFSPSSRPCNLFFPLSGKFSWIFLCLPPLDHLGLSSKVTSSERAPLTTLAKVTFLYSFHCL